jgi:hypothetical protein
MKDGGSAFPVLEYEGVTSESFEKIAQFTTGGMTLRDYFAGQALAGIVTNKDNWNIGNKAATRTDEYAKVAYALADAMLAEREK